VNLGVGLDGSVGQGGTRWVGVLKLNAREKTLGAGEKLEDFETHFRIKWC
jgi:hypothetical protein